MQETSVLLKILMGNLITYRGSAGKMAGAAMTSNASYIQSISLFCNR